MRPFARPLSVTSRRALLIGGGAGVEQTRLRRLPGLVGPDGAVPPVAVSVTRRQSSARGCSVDFVTMNAAPGLPVCVVLHGRGNTAGGMVTLGLPQFLVAAGAKFTMVAVDGGDSCWMPRTPADDPRRMLREELPGWRRSAMASTRTAPGVGCCRMRWFLRQVG